MAQIEDFLDSISRDSARIALFERILTPDGKEFIDQCMSRAKREEHADEIVQAIAAIVEDHKMRDDPITGYEMIRTGITMLLGAIASLHYFNNERSIGN